MPFSPDYTEVLSRQFDALEAEVARLRIENWQLRGALGYPVPGDVPEGPFKCGLCEARQIAAYEQSAQCCRGLSVAECVKIPEAECERDRANGQSALTDDATLPT